MKTTTTVTLNPIQAMLTLVKAVASLTVCEDLPRADSNQAFKVRFFGIGFWAEAKNAEGTVWALGQNYNEEREEFDPMSFYSFFRACYVCGTRDEVIFRCKQEVLHWLMHLYQIGAWEYMPEWKNIPGWPDFEVKEGPALDCAYRTWDDILRQQV